MIDLPPDLLANRFLLTTLIALALLLILAIVAARLQTARRGHAILAVLNESARGQVSMLRGPDTGGFVGSFQPPPEPFMHFVANYRSCRAA